jgi:hypothetical protein
MSLDFNEREVSRITVRQVGALDQREKHLVRQPLFRIPELATFPGFVS